jgi:hypothetical protein
MFGIVLLNSPKRMGPSSSSQIMGGFHLPPMTSMVAVMGQSSASWYRAKIFFTGIIQLGCQLRPFGNCWTKG